ncbi:11024_t:CDS:2, partial [Racocetra persica]
IEVHHVYVDEKENIKYQKCSMKVSNQIKKKVDDNNKAVKKVKINGEFAKASIRLSSNVNKISIDGHIDNVKFVGYIPGLEVDIDNVKVVQKFYIKLVIEALLDEVMKIDMIIRSLLEMLTKTEYSINNANNENDMIKVYKNESRGSSSDSRVNKSRNYYETRIQNKKDGQK